MNRYFTAILLWMLVAVACNAADYAVVVNRANPTGTLSANEVRQFFLGKRTTWPNGRPVVFILQKDPYVHESFVREVVKKSPQQFLSYWKKLLFTGQGIFPAEVAGDREVKSFVAANPGAVGYINKTALDESVKMLEITE